MDECEEKKLMDKIMKDPDSEFKGKERVCDKDVEQVLWKLNEEPKNAADISGKVTAGNNEIEDSTAEDILPGIGDLSAHSASL